MIRVDSGPKNEGEIVDVKHSTICITNSDVFTPLQLRASFISGPECSGFQEDWFKVPDSDSCSTN